MILQFLNDFADSSSSLNKEYVESFLKSQKMKMIFLVKNYVLNLETRLEGNMTSYKFNLTGVQNFGRERNEFLEKVVIDSKESIELKVKHPYDFFTKEVKKLDAFCMGIQNSVDVLLSATRTLI